MKRKPYIIHTLDDQEILLEEKCDMCNGAGIIRPNDKQWEELKRRCSKNREEIFLACDVCNSSGLIISSEGETLLKFIKQYSESELV